MRERAERAWPVLLTCRIFASNARVREKAVETMKVYEAAFGWPSLFVRVAPVEVAAFAALQATKIKVFKYFTGRDYMPYRPPVRGTRCRQ